METSTSTPGLKEEAFDSSGISEEGILIFAAELPPPLHTRGGDVAQLVRASDQHATDDRFFNSPVRQGIFLAESTFSADSLTVSVHPHVWSRVLTSVHMWKIL